MFRLANTTALAETLLSAATAFAIPPASGQFAIFPASWSPAPSSALLLPPSEVEVSIWADGAESLTSATYYEAIPRAFSPSSVTVTGTAAVAGSLAISGKTTHCNDTVAAALAGASPTVAGDTITIAFVQSAGAPATGALTNVGPAWTFTFLGGTTTVANFEAAIAATTGPYALVVSSAGTGANVLAASVDEFAAAALTGAADAILTHTAHGLLTGDGPFELSGGTLPVGLAASTDYWVVKTGANTFSVATSLANALAGIVVEFSTTGSGTITWAADPVLGASRLEWHAMALLGPAPAAGTVTLAASQACMTVCPHSAQAVAAAIGATIGSGSAHVSAEVRPRMAA